MSEHVVSSNLPAAAFILPLAAGALVFIGKPLGRWWWQGLALLASLATAVIGAQMVAAAVRGQVLVTWGNELRVDALSALMVAAISSIAFLATLYSMRYIMMPAVQARVGTEVVQRRLPTFYGLLLWFLGTMLWGCVTNNIIMLYVAVEATTLASGLLVAFYWDRRGLEAGYKYLMLLTIGIIFALFGCVLIYAAAAATKQLVGTQPLLISEVRNVIKFIPRQTALIAVAFLVVGFGTKAGIAPFHPWLPDAHAEAPTPISVLLSGVMIKMAAYALARTVSIFYPSWPQITIFLVALGAFTMVLGIVMAVVQDDLKRLLAYSSVSQMGYVLMGLGLGTYLGCYGGLFHLVNHAIYKALLFMCVGSVIYATGARNIHELGGLGKKMPITSACFFVGALAISGFPPLNGFMSKITIYLATAEAGMWWATMIAIFTSVLTLVALVHTAYTVFWGQPRSEKVARADVREVPVSMWLPMAILAAACVVLGIFPQAIYPLLDKAAAVLATLAK
jgi:proton-translocating NADH-quinone oxidoreductase chain N